MRKLVSKQIILALLVALRELLMSSRDGVSERLTVVACEQSLVHRPDRRQFRRWEPAFA